MTSFTKGTLCALFITAASGAANAQDNDTANNAGINMLADAICDAAKDHKYILLGDTNHGSSEIQEAFFDEGVITQIKDCLPTNAFVFEQPPSALDYVLETIVYRNNRKQRLIEQANELAELEQEFEDIKNSPEKQKELNERLANSFLAHLHTDYQAYYEDRIESLRSLIELSEMIFRRSEGDTIDNLALMASSGFDIRFYDPGYDLAPEDASIIDMLQDAYVDEPTCMNITLLFSIASASQSPAADFNRMMELLRGREHDNPIIADHILQNHPEGALIFYGSGHMSGVNDLDELLDDDDSYWITIEENHRTLDSEGSRGFEKLAPRTFPTQENPDQVFDIETNSILESLKNPNKPEYEQTTESEFNNCVANIPPEMRDGFTSHGGENPTYDDYRWLLDEDRAGVPPVFQDWVTPK